MPRGDRYHIPDPAWTKGPQRTIKALNADSKILKDLADRVCDLELAEDADGAGGLSVSEFHVCVAGEAKVTNIPNDGFRDP